MAHQPSDLSNHISEIHAFKPVENEKSRSSECNYWTLSVVCIFRLLPEEGGPVYGKQKLQGHYIPDVVFKSQEFVVTL